MGFTALEFCPYLLSIVFQVLYVLLLRHLNPNKHYIDRFFTSQGLLHLLGLGLVSVDHLGIRCDLLEIRGLLLLEQDLLREFLEEQSSDALSLSQHLLVETRVFADSPGVGACRKEDLLEELVVVSAHVMEFSLVVLELILIIFGFVLSTLDGNLQLF